MKSWILNQYHGAKLAFTFLYIYVYIFPSQLHNKLGKYFVFFSTRYNFLFVCLVDEGEAYTSSSLAYNNEHCANLITALISWSGQKNKWGQNGHTRGESEDELVKMKKQIYGEWESDSCIVSHRNHAFSFVEVSFAF